MTNWKKHVKLLVGAAWALSALLLALPSLPVSDWLGRVEVAEAHLNLYATRIEPALLGLSGLSFSSTALFVLFNLLRTKKITHTDIIQEVTSTTTLNTEKTILQLLAPMFEGLEHLSKQVAEVAQNRITAVKQTPFQSSVKDLIADATNQIDRVALQVKNASRTVADRINEAMLHIEAAKRDLAKADTPNTQIVAKNTISYWEGILSEIKKGF